MGCMGHSGKEGAWTGAPEMGMDMMLPDPSPHSPRDTEQTGDILNSLRFPRVSLDLVQVPMASAPHGKGVLV